MNTYTYTANDPLTAMDITQPDLFGAHRLRLGKNRPEMEFGCLSETGSGADATFDEVALYDFGGAGPGGIPPASPASLLACGTLALNRFREGRYYKESAYAGIGATPGLNRAGEYFSPTIRTEAPGRILALQWTEVVPRALRSPLPAGGKQGMDGDPGEDGRILLELADAAGGDYLRDASGLPIDGAFRNPASSRVGRCVDRPFRIHAVFQPNLEVPPGGVLEDIPILDPLALDDVTVVWEPAGGPTIVAWD